MRNVTFKRKTNWGTNWESKCWQNVFMHFYCNLMVKSFRLFSSIPRAMPKLKTKLNTIVKSSWELFFSSSTQRAIWNILWSGQMLQRHDNYMLWTKNYTFNYTRRRITIWTMASMMSRSNWNKTKKRMKKCVVKPFGDFSIQTFENRMLNQTTHRHPMKYASNMWVSTKVSAFKVFSNSQVEN